MVANPSARRRHPQASNRNNLPWDGHEEARGTTERGPKLNRIILRFAGFAGSRGSLKFVCFDFFDKQDLRGVDLSPVLSPWIKVNGINKALLCSICTLSTYLQK